MSFTFDYVPDDLAPLPAGGYGPAGLNGTLPGQGISQSFEVDLIGIELAGQVDYSVSVLRSDLPNPAVFIFDSNFQLIGSQDDSLLGVNPFLEFTPFSTGVYYFGITDLTGGIGDYTLVVTPSGSPIFFS